MNVLERTLIEKAGYANGWENIRESTPDRIVLYSARHQAEASVIPASSGDETWVVSFPKGPSSSELIRTLPELGGQQGDHQVAGEMALGRILRRAAELAMALPDGAAVRYAVESAKLDMAPPSATEALCLVKQRIGQNIYRQALMDYWRGGCAVTGIAIPELLRASHAKPWADCTTDAERLNAFNGFLLCAHLDALFDRGLMTFDVVGNALFASTLGSEVLQSLGLAGAIRLRWISPEHLPFIKWHREEVFGTASPTL